MRITEAQNIRLRQLVRDRPDNPTPIQIERYPWIRYNKLPRLKTLLPTPIEDATPQEILVAEQRLDLQTRNDRTFISARLMFGNQHLLVFGPITGVYTLAYIKIELISETTAPALGWHLHKCNFFPATIAQATLGRLLLPYTDNPAFYHAIWQRAAMTEYTTAITQLYEDDYLAWNAMSLAGGQPTDYIQLTLTLTER